jgi:hypothetical protein
VPGRAGGPQPSAAGALHLWLAFAGCAALAARFCLRPIEETDAGWHVAQGRLILAGRFLRTNTLNWPFPDEPWYPTTWLYDALLALADRRLGPLGLDLVTGALLLGATLLVGLACARAAKEPAAAWAMPAVFFALLPHAVVRPHLATWCAFAGVLALGLAARGRSRLPRAAALGVVALAGNLHAGAVFAAFALGCFSLEAALAERRAGRSPLPDLVLAALAPAALAANPGGLYTLGFLFFHLRVSDVVPLVEFARPTLQGDPAFFALLVPCAALALYRLRASPALAAIALAAAALGLRTQRLTQLLLLVGPVLLADALPALAARLPPEVDRRRAGALLAVLLVCVSALWADAGRRLLQTWEAGFSPFVLPVRAASFLDAEAIAGRGFNSFGDGGYLAYARPGVQTFADGRVVPVPAGFLPRWLEAEKTGESFRAFLAGYGVEWALATRLKERLGGYRLLESPGWALVYWDDLSEVWLRRDVPRFATLIDRLEYKTFKPYGRIVGKVAALDLAGLRALDAEVGRFLSTSPGEPFALVVACGAAVRQRRADAGARCAAAESAAANALRADALGLARQAAQLPPALQ